MSKGPKSQPAAPELQVLVPQARPVLERGWNRACSLKVQSQGLESGCLRARRKLASNFFPGGNTNSEKLSGLPESHPGRK